MEKPVITIEKDGPNGNIFAILGIAHAAIMEEGFKALKESRNYFCDGDLISSNFEMLGNLLKQDVMKKANSYEDAVKAVEKYVTINWI